MVLQYITWNVNPEIIQLGPLSLRWYGILFALGFVFGYLIFQRIFKKEKYSIEVLDSLLVHVAVGTIAGARLGHVLFYDLSYYLDSPWKILFVWEGGLASHGAAIGIVTSLYFFARKHKVKFLWILDRVVMVVALAGVCIRMGNLMNSEIYGIATQMPWGFIFVREHETVAKHPTQIYEALCYLAIFIFLFWCYTKELFFKHKGKISGIFMVLLFSARFMIEYIKNPQEDFEKTLPLNMGQILSIPFILIGLYLIFRKYKEEK
jgi:phosphatidylglycerol:prolipoprotein diacylglycerol transferase